MLAVTETAMPGIGISIPGVRDFPSRPYLAIRASGPMSRLPEFAPPNFPRLHEAFRQRKIAPGDGFFRYRRFGSDGGVDLDVANFTAEPVPGKEEIVSDVLPAGRYVHAAYRGPYDRLYDAFCMLDGWVQARGLAPAGRPGEPECQVEIYRISPAQTGDPAHWETDLLLKLTD